LQELQEFGVDLFQAKEWIDKFGAFDMNKKFIFNNMSSPVYRNPLRRLPTGPRVTQPAQVNYGYNDPSAKMGNAVHQAMSIGAN